MARLSALHYWVSRKFRWKRSVRLHEAGKEDTRGLRPVVPHEAGPITQSALLPYPSLVRCIAIYVHLSSRENITHKYTHARADTIIPIYMNMCKYVHTYTHTQCILHKRVGRLSSYLGASLHYRTRRSSRKERASERSGGWKPFSVPGTTGPSAKNQCDHPSQLARTSLPLVLRQFPSHFSSRILRATKIEVRARCEKELEEPRGLRTNEFPFWFRESNLHRGIAQVETIGETTKRRARYRPDRTDRGRSLFTGRRDGRTIASYVTWFPRTRR